MTTANNAGALIDADIAEDTMVDSAVEVKTQGFFKFGTYLRTINTELRAEIYQEVVKQVIDGRIIGIVRSVDPIKIETWNIARDAKPKIRELREILLDNSEAVLDSLEAIEKDVRLRIQLSMASQLSLAEIAELAAAGNFAKMAELCNQKQQQVQRHRHAAKIKRTARTAKTKTKKQP